MCTVQKCASVQGKCEQLRLIKYFPPPFLKYWDHWKGASWSFFSYTFSVFSVFHYTKWVLKQGCQIWASPPLSIFPSIPPVHRKATWNIKRPKTSELKRLEWRGFSSSVQCCTSSNTEEEGQLEFHFSKMKSFSSCLFCITKVYKIHYI